MENYLKTYVSGWLQHKRIEGKYENLWCALKGHLVNKKVVAGYLVCLQEPYNNSHENKLIAAYNIDVFTDITRLHSIKGEKTKKCGFVISIGDKLLYFRAEDKKSREQWIYAFVDRLGKGLLPAELPSLNNHIRSASLLLYKPKNKTSLSSIARSVSEPTSKANLSTSPGQHQLDEPVKITPGVDSWLDWIAWRGTSSEKIMQQLQQLHVPESLFSLVWYHGPITRQDSIERLRNQPIGTYLLRNCSSDFGCFTLTIKDTDSIKHHKIGKVGESQYQLDDFAFLFPTPQEAAEFYMKCKTSTTFKPIALSLNMKTHGVTKSRSPPRSAPPFETMTKSFEQFNCEEPLERRMANNVISRSHGRISEEVIPENTCQATERPKEQMPATFEGKSKVNQRKDIPSQMQETSYSAARPQRNIPEPLRIQHSHISGEAFEVNSYLEIEDVEGKRNEKDQMYCNQDIIEDKPPPIPPRSTKPNRKCKMNNYETVSHQIQYYV